MRVEKQTTEIDTTEKITNFSVVSISVVCFFKTIEISEEFLGWLSRYALDLEVFLFLGFWNREGVFP